MQSKFIYTLIATSIVTAQVLIADEAGSSVNQGLEYESYKNTAVPPEIVVKHREDFYSSFLFLPARLQKFIALWSILTETEQENIGKTIELLAMRGR